MPEPAAITALLADDEDVPRLQLAAALKDAWPELKPIEAVNGTDAWDAFLEHEPRICFLDVRMPGMTGIEVAQRIGQQAHIVFVAAPADHALRAFEAGSVDHVVKPLDSGRLAAVVERLKARLDRPPPDLRELLDRLAGQVRKPAPLEVLQAGIGHDARLIRSVDIVYLETEGRYTRVVDSEGEALIRTPLKELLGQLDAANFRQIQRGLIVNRRCITAVTRNGPEGLTLTLRGREGSLPVGRQFQSLFAEP